MKTKATAIARKATLGAAATGAVFGLQHQVDAAIVYSGLQNLTINWANAGGVTANRLIDLNNDGINEFMARGVFFSAPAHTTSTDGHFFPAVIRGSAAFRDYGGGRLAFNASGQLKKFASGNLIPAAPLTMGGGYGFHLVKHDNGAVVDGTWAQGATGFAGLQFVADGKTLFGWARLKWEDTDAVHPYADKLTVIDWAYNDVNLASITAGEGIPVAPEPSRALLALAGLGATALRRRRKAV